MTYFSVLLIGIWVGWYIGPWIDDKTTQQGDD